MLHPLLNTAIRAARAAGDVILRGLDKLDSITVIEKKANDFATDVDRQAEAKIIDLIRKMYPDHGILAEETYATHPVIPQDEYVWIIDPLDGTTNFMHGLPHFSVSIAVQYRQRIEHGVIYDPIRRDLFIASRGRGAQCNDRRMRVSTRKQLQGSLLATGFPYRQQVDIDTYLQGFRALLQQSVNIRRAGSAALDLAYVAAGHFDGFWEYGLQPWDIAAGLLMVQEAGGLVTGFHGQEALCTSGDIISGNPKILKALLQHLHPYAQ